MLLACAAIGLGMVVVMLSGWAFQARVGNAGWVDVFWTFGTGLGCALGALAAGPVPWRRALAAALVLLWSARLGAYVAARVAGGAEDARYARMRADLGAAFQRRMLLLVLVQGPFSTMLAIAVLYAARQPDPAFRPWDALGIALALGAICGEAMADRQMRRFRANQANRGKVCDHGLWRFSRHPNYLFEVIGWCAYPALGAATNQPWSLLSLLSPAMMYLTLRYASGVPPLEAAMLASRGEAYRRYQARTGAILPRLSALWRKS